MPTIPSPARVHTAISHAEHGSWHRGERGGHGATAAPPARARGCTPAPCGPACPAPAPCALLRSGRGGCSALAAGQGSRARWNNAHSSDTSRAVRAAEETSADGHGAGGERHCHCLRRCLSSAGPGWSHSAQPDTIPTRLQTSWCCHWGCWAAPPQHGGRKGAEQTEFTLNRARDEPSSRSADVGGGSPLGATRTLRHQQQD